MTCNCITREIDRLQRFEFIVSINPIDFEVIIKKTFYIELTLTTLFKFLNKRYPL